MKTFKISSLKFSLYEMPLEKLLINGYFEKIGYDDSFWTIKMNGENIIKESLLTILAPLINKPSVAESFVTLK